MRNLSCSVGAHFSALSSTFFPVTKAAIVARSSRQIGLVNLRGMKQLMHLVDFAQEI